MVETPVHGGWPHVGGLATIFQRAHQRFLCPLLVLVQHSVQSMCPIMKSTDQQRRARRPFKAASHMHNVLPIRQRTLQRNGSRMEGQIMMSTISSSRMQPRAHNRGFPREQRTSMMTTRATMTRKARVGTRLKAEQRLRLCISRLSSLPSSTLAALRGKRNASNIASWHGWEGTLVEQDGV